VYIIEKKLTMKFFFFSFGKNINKILNNKIGICAMFITKHLLNKMHPIMFTKQVGSFVGKRVHFHL